MVRKSTRTFRVYLRLLGRDIRRSARQLIRTKLARGQLVIILSRPSFRTSRYYYTQWRKARKVGAPRRRALAAASLLLLAGCGALLYGLLQLTDMQPTTPQAAAAQEVNVPAPAPVPAKPPSMSKSLPVHLSIPDIAVDTDLIQLGQNTDGSLETPVGYDIAGWYKYSPTPGEIGPAIIVGHVDNYQGAAVFFRLKELQPGQKITITREDNSVATFTVTRLAQVDQDHFPTQEVYGNTSDAQLRLITCGGPFNHLTGEYTQNVVVFATYLPPAAT